MNTGIVERRFKAASGMLAAAGHKLAGVAAVFNKETVIDNSFSEVIRPGAFRRSLQQRKDILCLVDHDPSRLLGRTSSGTLKLYETAQGLEFELDLPETREAEDLLALARRGDLGGMSFAFTVGADGQRWQCQCRELLDVELMEISVVHAWPAYTGTSVYARSCNGMGGNLLLRKRIVEVLSL